MVARRVSGVPLEVVLGWAEFCGLRIALLPGVFVPRRRSALLVDLAADSPVGSGSATPPQDDHFPLDYRVVDLCCGSGAIGAAVAARLPRAEVHAADLDPLAVACARTNLPPERVHQGDLYDALPTGLRGQVDVLVVNAPYVPSDAIALMPTEARDHEPRVALDGGQDGVDLHRRVAAGASDWLRAGGRLVIETSTGQAALTAQACTEAGLVPEIVTDEDRDATAVVAAAP